MSRCSKCRQASPFENDSWCLGCSGVETLVCELSAPWKFAGFRAAANDVIVSTVRAIKSLRDLDSSSFSAGVSRAAASGDTRPSLPRSTPAAERPRSRAPTPPPPPVKVQEGDSVGEESEEEEEFVDDRVEGACPKADPARKPPEPNHPPRHHQQGEQRREERRERSRSHKKRHSGKRHSGSGKRRGSRGGSKHPRVYRTLENPDLRVHRRPPQSFWTGARSYAGHRPGEGRR